MSEAVLSLHNIARHFAQGEKKLEVLRGLNLEVKAGEMVALVGPSGSGKSTLLQIAGLLDTPDAGEVMIGGMTFPPPAGGRGFLRGEGLRTAARAAHIGFVYQFHHLLPEFSARENVAMPQMIAGKSEASANLRADALLAALGLNERASHRPARLSGGEQQRVAIARALANDPQLLLADEPTGNLDPSTAAEVFNIFLKLVRGRGLAALVATHNMALAKKMDRTVTLEDGMLT